MQIELLSWLAVIGVWIFVIWFVRRELKASKAAKTKVTSKSNDSTTGTAINNVSVPMREKRILFEKFDLGAKNCIDEVFDGGWDEVIVDLISSDHLVWMSKGEVQFIKDTKLTVIEGGNLWDPEDISTWDPFEMWVQIEFAGIAEPIDLILVVHEGDFEEVDFYWFDDEGNHLPSQHSQFELILQSLGINKSDYTSVGWDWHRGQPKASGGNIFIKITNDND